MTLLDETRPVNGVAPTASVPTVGHDAPAPQSDTIIHDGDTRALEVKRLYELLDIDRRFATPAIHLALEAFEAYDPKTHRLSHAGKDCRQPDEISYADYFRLVAFDRFQRTINVGLAAKLLDILLAESRAT